MARSDPRSDWREKYPARCALWAWHDAGRIDLLAPEGHVLATLDPWQTAIFHGADGNHTVAEFMAWLLGHYENPEEIPPDLDETIAACLQYLVEQLHAVAICERPQNLPSHYDLPRQEQDPDEGRQ